MQTDAGALHWQHLWARLLPILFFLMLSSSAAAYTCENATVITYMDGATNYTSCIWYSNGSFSNTPSIAGTGRLFMVAGGAPGGDFASYSGNGGGAAGGLYTNNSSTISAGQTIIVKVGNGGISTNGTNGSDSIFGTEIAKGGGIGANRINTIDYGVGADGGSGGGGLGASGNQAGGNGTAGQGNNGGAGGSDLGGGGGGANSTGQDGDSGGGGGTGLNFNVTGTPTTYACGGGGGSYSVSPAGPAGCGTAGEGGATASGVGGAGTNGTGSGGGGGGTPGGDGGSGIVVFSFPTATTPPNQTIANCTIISEGNLLYNITQNISIAGATCINITASNVTLDCQGHTIAGNGTAGTFGVYASTSNNTIKNCVVQNFDSDYKVETGTNNTLINNTAINGSRGFDIAAASTSLYNNRANAPGGGPTYGYYLSSSNNILRNNSAVGEDYGFRLQSNSGNLIDGNSANQASYSIALEASANNNISNNTFGISTTGAYVYGGGAGGNIFFNNTFNSTSLAINIFDAENTFYQNNITSDLWVQDSIGGGSNYYNVSGIGNIYYALDGTPSWSLFDISTTIPPNWANNGTARPFNSSNAPSYWTGSGFDWFPWTENAILIATLTSPSDGAEYPLNTTSVPISFNCTGDDSTGLYLVNLSANSALYDNATGITAINGTTTNFTINMTTTFNGTITWGAVCYNSTSSAFSSNRTFTIRNFAPNITALTIAQNGSVYQLGPLYFNITVSHQDLHPTNISYSWLKNGVNQTAMAGNIEIPNGTNVQINASASPYTIDDNWSVSVYALDNGNYSTTSTSGNTTIQNYFGNLSFYAPSAYTHIYTQAYMNFTLNGAASATAYFVFGSSNTTMTNSGTGNSYVFATSTAIAGATTNGTWYYKATLANGSTYETSYSESINVSNAGFFLCNASINTTSIFYQFQDATLFTPINATFTGTYVWVGDDGISTSVVLSNVSTNMSICIYPDTFNRVAVATEVASAAGYLTSVVTVPAMNYSAVSLNKIVYLINTSAGAFYTFQTINQYNTPISGASVVVLKVGGTTSTTYITDITGSVYVPLIQLSTYTVNVSASGYNNVSFPFVAGSTTTIQIKLSITGAGVSPPNFTDVFQTVQYVLLPDSTSIDNTTPIVFSTNSPNGTLQSFGLYIFRNYQGNSTLVYNASSTSTTGGSLSYLATSEGMYSAYPWFKAVGYANYTPFPTTFSYGNATSPTSQAATAMQGGGIISGWAYYFIALVLAMLVAAGLSKYTIDGAAFGGLAVLVLATILNPSIVVYNFGMFAVTPVHLTTMAGVMAASVLYLRQYGV